MEKRPVDKQFLRQGKDYTTLICYKKAVIIYDITYHFATSIWSVATAPSTK